MLGTEDTIHGSCLEKDSTLERGTKAIQKLASKSAGKAGLGKGARFNWRESHKKSSVYYRLGKHQRLSRPQNYIAATQDEPRGTNLPSRKKMKKMRTSFP